MERLDSVSLGLEWSTITLPSHAGSHTAEQLWRMQTGVHSEEIIRISQDGGQPVIGPSETSTIDGNTGAREPDQI